MVMDFKYNIKNIEDKRKILAFESELKLAMETPLANNAKYYGKELENSPLVQNEALGMISPRIVQYCLKRQIIHREAQNGCVHWRVSRDKYADYQEKMKVLAYIISKREKAKKVDKEELDSLE